MDHNTIEYLGITWSVYSVRNFAIANETRMALDLILGLRIVSVDNLTFDFETN